jgi:magnesium-protoporphyrin IX monomethyl ester (oxidative) cyclase
MKTLLINPPETGVKNSLMIVGLPLGILYIAAVLEKNGKKVEVFDSIIYDTKLNIRDTGNGTVHVGASWRRIEEEIRRKKPDIVGISNQFSSQAHNAVRVAEIVKKVNRKIVTVIGGPHASYKPDDFLKNKSVDFVIKGEGEYAFNELVDRLEKERSIKKVNNLAFSKGKKTIVNLSKQIENLDELPFPAYHRIDIGNYFKLMSSGAGRILVDTESKRQISMITSRGCPYNCIFCSIHCHMGRKWRAHSADYVVRHIKYLIEQYKIEHISFEDDNLVLDTERFEKILDSMEKNGIRITWDTPNGIRADRLNYELVKKMKRNGCTSLKIGIESGDQHILDNIVGKNLRLEKVVEAASLCKKFKITLGGFFIIGFPNEKKQNIENTLNFAYMLKRDYFVEPVITIAMPLIGTKLYDISKEKDYLKEGHNPSEFVGTLNQIIETEDFNIDYLKSVRNNFYKRIVLLQVYQMLKSPSLFLRYARLLKNPKKGVQILMYLARYIK